MFRSWFSQGSDLVRLQALETRVDQLDAKFTKVSREILEATETLDRVTRRSFRLKEQLLRLESDKEPIAQNSPVSRHDLLKRA
jgi:hypothetical protein